MKDASGFQTQGVLYSTPHGQHRHPQAGPPDAGGVEYNTPCVQKPVGPVTLTALWLPTLTPAPRQPRSARARPDRILHARPSLRY